MLAEHEGRKNLEPLQNTYDAIRLVGPSYHGRSIIRASTQEQATVRTLVFRGQHVHERGKGRHHRSKSGYVEFVGQFA
jgi:hypothetical protein